MAAIAAPVKSSMFNSTLFPHGVTKAAGIIFAVAFRFINEDKINRDVRNVLMMKKKKELSALLHVVFSPL